VFLGCKVERNEDYVQQMCKDVEAMELAAQGRRRKKISRSGHATRREGRQAPKVNLGTKSAPTTFNFRIFGS
jgi:hypothetical protein